MGALAGQSFERESLLIEFNDAVPRMGFDVPARVRTLVHGQWRLSIYLGHAWGELYDRSVDPHDTNNLWTSPEHVAIKADLLAELAQQLTALMDESPRAQRLA